MATVEVVSTESALHEEKIEETNKPQDIAKEDAVVHLDVEAPELKETKGNEAVAEPEAGEEVVAPEVEALATEVEAKAAVADEPAHDEDTPEVVVVEINAKVAPEPVVEVAEEANEETQDPKDDEKVKPKEAEEKIIDEAVPPEKADE